MRIHWISEEILALEQVDDLAGELLRRIPESADPTGSAQAEARMFPTATGGADVEADEEWQEFVKPELHQIFSETLQLVREDLRSLVPAGSTEERTLRITVANLDAWIHALNQARIALSARFDFSEEDLEGDFAGDGDPRSLALIQVHFYGVLQEFFLRQVDEE